MSVIVNGQELPSLKMPMSARGARKLLERRYRWWQTAFAERRLKAGNSLIAPIFFRIRIDSMTGLGAVAERTSSPGGIL